MFFTPPNLTHTTYVGQVSNTQPSPKLWSQMRSTGISPDGSASGRWAGDDFMGFGIGTAVATSVAYYVSNGGTYKSYEDAGGSIAGVVANGGVIRMTTDADDNQENWLQYSSSGCTLGAIADAAGSDRKTIFETRWKTSAVVGNIFIGLSEEALAVADTITDAGAMVSKDFIGFFVTEGAPTALTAVYRKAGQTMQTVFTWGTAIAADTWYKTGFIYDPEAISTQRIKFFINNTEQTTYVTSTQIAAATFPDEQQLTFLAGHKNVTDITTFDVDWWSYWQAGF